MARKSAQEYGKELREKIRKLRQKRTPDSSGKPSSNQPPASQKGNSG